jgi:hypothetical protein
VLPSPIALAVVASAAVLAAALVAVPPRRLVASLGSRATAWRLHRTRRP